MGGTIALYGATIFLSAALLFLIEPIFGRMVLPLLGGSPAVWNTALVFFQAALLAGYAYAHASIARLGARRQAVLHLLILLLALAVLPVAIPAGWSIPRGSPVIWMLGLMVVTIGAPFFAVATTSPVVQSWFAATGHRQAADPYFLYAAGNAGSMLALLSYPLWVEPHFRLAPQSRAWRWGYGLFVLMVAACAVRLWKSPAPAAARAAAPDGVSSRGATLTRLRWVLLAFVPSSLLLSVTLYLSSEIAPVPLLWVLPMAIYLLTFILAFLRRPLLSRTLLAGLFPLALLPLVLVIDVQATQPIGWLMLLHLAAFFLAALICHTELAASRPSSAHLAEFYLWIALGGALGGICNALIAPLIFHSVAEYPLALVLACAVCARSGAGEPRGFRRGDWLWPVLLAAFTIGLVLVIQSPGFARMPPAAALVFGGPALMCYFFSFRALRFTLGIAALLWAGSFYRGDTGRVLHAERSFFGVHRVTLDSTGNYHLLLNGKTLHGMQSVDPARRGEALAYYHRTGPIGEVLALYGGETRKTIAAVGLGAGALASFAQPGQAWTYFEIDPVVLKLASDPRFFSFLRDSRAKPRVVLGDARLSLDREPEGKFDLIILDAYSSDAIPVHLVTREALALYLRKLAPGGLLAFHISNQHLDLEPVFGNLARDARLIALTRDDSNVSRRELALGKAPSLWLVMARRPEDLARLAADARWLPSRRNDRQAVWTDDYSSVLSVFRWQ